MSSCQKCQRGDSNADKVEGHCPNFENMSDGRAFTSYLSRCEENNSLTSNSGVMNSYEYRMFLQHNAGKIIEQKRGDSESKLRCVPCFDFDEPGTMLPEQSKQYCDTNTCNFRTNYNEGLGLGRDFSIKSRTPLLSDKQKQMPKGQFLELYR
jgi:hypothetical protein